MRFLISVVMISLAWALRGQFGHLKGAMIPGAAAATILLLSKKEKGPGALGLALILGPLGFALGGHMSYGRLIEGIRSNPALPSVLPGLLQIFAIGAVWGGLGMSFLGFAVSEKPFQRRDFIFLLVLGLIWGIVLGIFNLETYDLLLFAAGLLTIHLYNGFVKKSSVVTHFGIWGVLGFGAAFVFALWWTLRDQILGFIGGLALWQAMRQAEKNRAPVISTTKGRSPSTFARDGERKSNQNPGISRLRLEMTVDRIGLLFYTVGIPAVCTVNVLRHWWERGDAALLDATVSAIGALAVIFFVMIGWTLWRSGPPRRLTVFFATLFFIWFLSLAAIAKETVPRGFQHWEAAYTFFLIDSVVLTLLLCILEFFLSNSTSRNPNP